MDTSIVGEHSQVTIRDQLKKQEKLNSLRMSNTKTHTNFFMPHLSKEEPDYYRPLYRSEYRDYPSINDINKQIPPHYSNTPEYYYAVIRFINFKKPAMTFKEYLKIMNKMNSELTL